MKQLLKLIIFLFPALLFGQTDSNAGTNFTKEIKLGMEVPPDAVGKTVDGIVVPAIRALSQELVILDFMNTSCTSCIAALPRLNKLQQANKNLLKIVSISYEKKDRVKAFRENNELFRSNKLDFVVEDSVWAKYFPHQTVSHMVWVYRGKVVAITLSEFVDQDMIDHVLKNGNIDLPVKNDFLSFDFSRPLIENRTGKHSFLTGYIEGAFTNFGQQVDTVNQTVREYIVNAEIIPAFLYCYGKILQLPFIKDSRIVVERRDKERFVFDEEKSKYRESWNRRNGISYEATFDLNSEPKFNMKAMIADMESKLGVETKLESRPVLCWVIKDNPEGKAAVQSEDGQTLADFAFMLDLDGDIPPVIIESSNNGKYKFSGGTSGATDLKTALKKNGFLMVEEERQIPCFILK